MSSSRKNKRDLTSRTVDFLNRVNSVTDNASTNPQSRSKPRVRRLHSQPINRFGSKTPQVPRGDAIWDIPSDFSEEEARSSSRRRDAQTQPLSLRRSQRARKPVQVEDTPTRTSRRLARVIEDRHERSSEEDDSEAGEELNAIIDKQLGGAKLIQSVNQNRNTDVNHGPINEDRGEQEDEGDRASEEPVEFTSPSKRLRIQEPRTTDAQQSQEGDPEWVPDTAADEELGEEDDEGSDTNGPPNSTHIIQTRRLTQELSSPRATRRHTFAAQAAEKEVEEPSGRPDRRSLPVQNGLSSTRDKQGDRLAGVSEVSESVSEESESVPESSYEPEEEEEEEEEEEAEASRHLPDTQREEPSITARPSKRRRTDQYQRNPQVEILRTQPTPPPVHSTLWTPVDNQSRRSSRHRSESPVVATRTIGAISDDAQNEALVRSVRDNAGDKAWFAEASNLGQQKENWKILVDEAEELKGNIDPSRDEWFREIDKELSRLRTKYRKINWQLRAQQGPLRQNLRACEENRQAILEEGVEIIDDVYWLSVRKAESDALELAHQLIEQFEARVFPTIIKVILLCFEAYYTNRQLFPSAYRHLDKAMELLQKFCRRITSLRAERYVRCEVHSRNIRKPLEDLRNGLKGNLLQRRVNETEGASRGDTRREWTDDERTEGASRGDTRREWTDDERTEGASRGDTRREWTDDEKTTLLDGLRRFLGEDRYLRMAGRYGPRLRHRTLQELQTKAREIRDRYIPRIQKELKTVDGRRKWQWLLSVNDGQPPVSVD